MEEYKKERVLGYEDYQVDTSGIVYGKNGKPLSPSTNPKGYQMVIFSIDGEQKGFGIHQLVARQFVYNPSPETKTQVNHKDGNKLNNHISNLEWTTPKENMCHARDVLGIHYGEMQKTPIIGINKKDTSEIKYFSGLREAGRFLRDAQGLTSTNAGIWKVLSGYGLIYGGYYWIYGNCEKDIDWSYIEERIDYVLDRGHRKLSFDDAQWIRANYIPQDSEFGMRAMSRLFQVDHTVISCIIHNKTYLTLEN